MIATLTNASGGNLNVAVYGEDGASLGGGHLGEAYATHRTNPLPYPFDAQGGGTLANSATIVIGIRPSDWRRQNPASALEPSGKLNDMVQKGQITLSYGAEAGIQHPEEIWVGDVT